MRPRVYLQNYACPVVVPRTARKQPPLTETKCTVGQSLLILQNRKNEYHERSNVQMTTGQWGRGLGCDLHGGDDLFLYDNIDEPRSALPLIHFNLAGQLPEGANCHGLCLEFTRRGALVILTSWMVTRQTDPGQTGKPGGIIGAAVAPNLASLVIRRCSEDGRSGPQSGFRPRGDLQFRLRCCSWPNQHARPAYDDSAFAECGPQASDLAAHRPGPMTN